MSYDALKDEVCRANRRIAAEGLAKLTWGNASGADRQAGVMAIKPSGVAYDALRPEDIVCVSLETGETVDGALRPSSDTPTHRRLYRAFEGIGGIVHTHSMYATVWAQAGLALPALGTTHADTFHGPVPVTRPLMPHEIQKDYERHTGAVIEEYFRDRKLDPAAIPAALVPHHGPFAWGADVDRAIEHALILEEVARMAFLTRTLRPDGAELPRALLDKHFLRKHGTDAYYGQG
jgi:L-ribulose-5-phosphate 4-epimerase